MSRTQSLAALETVALIAMGGALGANVRYIIGLVVPGLGGTFVANVVGCFLLGFIVYEAQYTSIISNRSRLVFGTGFLSSLTTYSTFAVETVQAAPMLGVANVVGNYAVGFAAVLVGRTVARWVRDGSAGVDE
jgi:CrcB protein